MVGNKILLTGAGFTHNFELPLAKHIWAMIFNDPNIQKASNIRDAMLQNYDYESLYAKILNNKSSNNREVFLKQIDKVFNDIFEKLCTEAFWLRKSKLGISFSDVRNFIKLFKKEQSGFLFTLNQDLFLERLFLGSETGLSCPFIGNPLISTNDNTLMALKQPYNQLHHYGWQGSDCIMPSEEELVKRKKEFELRNYSSLPIDYFKLHGSIGWKYERSDIDKIPLVMGTHKSDRIDNEPLFKEYLAIFESALSEPDSSMLIIGYGFGDAHINRHIFNAVDNHGLKLHILSPESIAEFREKLKSIKEVNNHHAERIYRSIYGYYETTLKGVFPYDKNKEEKLQDDGISSQSLIWQQISSNFFGF
jgi:hypothetical protein